MSAQARGRPRVDFEQYKDTLYRLYITECRPLDEVRQFMENSHGFKARYSLSLFLSLSIYIYIYIKLTSNSKNTYKRQFDAWEFKKRKTNFVNNPLLVEEIKEL